MDDEESFTFFCHIFLKISLQKKRCRQFIYGKIQDGAYSTSGCCKFRSDNKRGQDVIGKPKRAEFQKRNGKSRDHPIKKNVLYGRVFVSTPYTAL